MMADFLTFAEARSVDAVCFTSKYPVGWDVSVQIAVKRFEACGCFVPTCENLMKCSTVGCCCSYGSWFIDLLRFVCGFPGVVSADNEDEAEGPEETADGEVQRRGGPRLRRSGQVIFIIHLFYYFYLVLCPCHPSDSNSLFFNLHHSL